MTAVKLVVTCNFYTCNILGERAFLSFNKVFCYRHVCYFSILCNFIVKTKYNNGHVYQENERKMVGKKSPG